MRSGYRRSNSSGRVSTDTMNARRVFFTLICAHAAMVTRGIIRGHDSEYIKFRHTHTVEEKRRTEDE